MNRTERRDKRRWLFKELKEHNKKKPKYKDTPNEVEQVKRVDKMILWMTRKNSILKAIQDCL